MCNIAHVRQTLILKVQDKSNENLDLGMFVKIIIQKLKSLRIVKKFQI